jgi:hypothetical protein
LRVKPPSTAISAPFRYDDLSDARKSTASDIARLADPAGRDRCASRFQHARTLVHGLAEFRQNHAGANGVAPNSVRPPFDGKLPRQHCDAGL